MFITNTSKIKINETNTLQGFIKDIRIKGAIAFVIIQDITGIIQLTFIKKNNEALFDELQKLTIESVITVTGIVKQNESVKLNGIEMLVDSLIIESIAASPLPLDSTSLIDQRLDYR
jgi:aspartyl-tRNA synthetase